MKNLQKRGFLLWCVILLVACNEDPIRSLSITAFAPESEGVGNVVLIEGRGFGLEVDVVNVDFNGAPAEILSLSDTSLRVLVPSAARTGPISILVDDQSARSTIEFTVLDGTWTRKQSIPAEVGFGAAVSFVHEGKGYIGTGGDNGRILAEFWQYDSEGDTWTDLPSIPNGARRFSSSFVIGDKAYVALGVKDNETEITREVYSLDLITQAWDRLNDFPGALPTFRDTYASFVIENVGYLLLGKDIWSYDPVTDEWMQLDAYLGIGSSSHIAEVIDGLAYVGLGFNDANDWWSYDPQTEEWNSLAAYPETLTWGLQSFQIQEKIYVVGKACWEYDPMTDRWTQRNSHPEGRRFAVAFSIDDKGYFGTGISESGSSGFRKDFWEFSLE